MNRIWYTSWTRLRTLNVVRFKTSTPPITVNFNLFRFCSVSSDSEKIPHINSGADDFKLPEESNSFQEDDINKEEDFDPPPAIKAASALKAPPPPTKKPETGGNESLKDRLFRLSSQSPDQFKPTEGADVHRVNKYADAPFPDQQSRRIVRNPIKKGAKINYDTFNECTTADDGWEPRENNYGNDRGGYGGGGYNSRGGGGYRGGYSRGGRGGGGGYGGYDRSVQSNSNYSRPARDFDGDPIYTRPNPTNKYQQSSRSSYDEDDDEEAFVESYSKRQQSFDRRKIQKDFDLDDNDFDEIPSPPRRSSRSDVDNQRAIRNAYQKRFPTDGRREFHSYAPRRSESLPDFNNIDGVSLNKLVSHNGLSTYAKDLQYSKVPRKTKTNVNLTTTQPLDDFVPNDEDADVFGNLGNPKFVEPESHGDYSHPMMSDTLADEPERDDVVFKSAHRMNIKRLTYEVVGLLKGHKLTEALDLFTTNMTRGGFRYDLSDLSYLYRILINECGKVGHVNMAFRLFREMKSRGIMVKDSVYTSLFNACSNSTWNAAENLEKMNKLRSHMESKGLLANKINYHAMIKAYGRCGDINEAFTIVDEMTTRNENALNATSTTFNFLLQACISNTDNGFRHALFTIDKLRSMNYRLNIHGYNLLLRATRECGVAIPPAVQKLVDMRQAKLLALRSGEEKDKSMSPVLPSVIEAKSLIAPHEFDFKSSLQIIDSKCSNVEVVSNLFTDSELDAIAYFKKPEYRLSALGGVRGILQDMKRDRVAPDLKTVTELARITKPLHIGELITLLEKNGLKPDVQFFNAAIRNLSECKNTKQARNVLNMMNEYHLSPDIYTWGSFAVGCNTWSEARRLLENMEASHFTPSSDVIGILLTMACMSVKPLYITSMIREMQTRGYKAIPAQAEELEELKFLVNKGIVDMERGKELDVPYDIKMAITTDTETFLSEWSYFKKVYKNFKQSAIKIEPQDPWESDMKARLEWKRQEKYRQMADLD